MSKAHTNQENNKKKTKSRKALFIFCLGFSFAILCFVTLNRAMKPVSKSEYCGSRCHEMNTAYHTWELSAHGANHKGFRVECVDCHLPPKDHYFTHLIAKGYEGGKDFYMHYLGPEYDGEIIRQRILQHLPNERCQYCHDDLLNKPSSTAARTAHLESLHDAGKDENKCVRCHEDTGHQRINKLYSP
ncbi:MAG: NapC/NirT family cytochrome c [Sedimentisphaerales bacterium]|nr:NapC/NirT family cytochrome c [Sedimentisphaerales bacterium]